MGGSTWGYPAVNVAHVLGVALLLGAIAVLDLRLLGLWRAVSARALVEPTVRVAATGFVVAVVSGALLFTVQAGEYVDNPFLWAKFALIGVAVVNLAWLRRAPAWAGADESILGWRVRTAAAVSLACWTAAAVAGRLIAYW